MDGKNQMNYEQLLKKIREQSKYWENLVHYTKPEFYENTVDQSNAWKALLLLIELHHHAEDPDHGWLCAVCDQGPGPCETFDVLEKALNES